MSLIEKVPNKIYRASTVKIQRRSQARLDQLDQQIIDVLKEDHPQSVRHVFYRMTDPRLLEPVEKSDRGYRHVQERCVKLRRSGRIPYNWIADMSRRGYFVSTFSGTGDFLSRVAGMYRADLWQSASFRCEVWCESRSIASVILKDCNELAVDLYPCSGFSSLSFIHEAAMAHNASEDIRPLVILYIGDYDPAGVLIDVALERELRLHLDNDIDMQFQRIAINENQIAAYDLPTKPRKATDARSQQVASTVEAEAMPAHCLRALLRDSIESLLPENALAVAKVAEESERKGLRALAGHYRDYDNEI
ncbi:conserved hypothetical protein [Candidatus Methylobacter favarea]|uniref:Uncharacterized protein n=1 Tax=Candidatus Methylobacter favarea TaxID=2707345 RepID=A0A8S0X3E6_9GAMM|nr:hypothetical protein [Candidatus Methylobacter favarea]CAA9892674.1 conserved hypothetical protein [Candidatus Methylobacter favarea]